MKKIKLFALTFLAAFCTLTFNACSDEDDPTPTPDEKENEADKENDKISSADYYDIWVRVGKTSADRQILVQNVTSLEASDTPLDFTNKGVELTGYLQEETTFKDGYYYQIPVSNDRFSKYLIYGNEWSAVKERPYGDNTYQTYRYTHAWLDDNTLIIMSANGKKNQIIWTKLNTTDMSILAEGTLPIEIAEGGQFSTSGILRYRQSDGTLIYFFQRKKADYDARSFYVAFIKAEDMSVIGEETISLEEEKTAEGFYMGGTAYGELLQEKTFFDENGHLYLSCDIEINYPEKEARFIRIKKGEFKVDESYKGYSGKTGKIVSCSYLTNGKALLYIIDPTHTNAGWGSSGGYNCYYAIWDIASDNLSDVMYNGSPLPFCSGQWSQRHAVVGDKAYIGTNPESESPAIYIYDINTGDVVKGLTIKEGYEFFRLVPMTKANKQ